MSSSPVFRHTVYALLLGTSLITGCSCSSPSSGDDDVKVIQQDSYGQQLIDLDEAYKKGLLTEKEYQKSRKAIIDKMKD